MLFSLYYFLSLSFLLFSVSFILPLLGGYIEFCATFFGGLGEGCVCVSGFCLLFCFFENAFQVLNSALKHCNS